MGGAASHGQVTQEEKLTWQSPAATVSVSLPRVGGGGGGSQQTSPTSRFSTTLHSCAFCTSSKTGESKIRWSFHTLSHKDQGVKKKREDVGLLTLALSTMVLENVVPNFLTAVGQFRKAKDLPRCSKTNLGLSLARRGGGVNAVLPGPSA